MSQNTDITIKEYPTGRCSIIDNRGGVGWESALYESRELAQKAIDEDDIDFDINLLDAEDI